MKHMIRARNGAIKALNGTENLKAIYILVQGPWRCGGAASAIISPERHDDQIGRI